MHRRILRFFDWRFVLSTAFLALVFVAASNSWTTAAERDRLIDQVDRQHAAAVVERREAARERAEIRATQRDLQAQYQALLEQQKALLVWLRHRGIVVPPDLVSAANADPSTVRAEPKPEPERRRPAAEAPATSESGDSGKAQPPTNHGGAKGQTSRGSSGKTSRGSSGKTSRGSGRENGKSHNH